MTSQLGSVRYKATGSVLASGQQYFPIRCVGSEMRLMKRSEKLGKVETGFHLIDAETERGVTFPHSICVNTPRVYIRPFGPLSIPG